MAQAWTQEDEEILNSVIAGRMKQKTPEGKAYFTGAIEAMKEQKKLSRITTDLIQVWALLLGHDQPVMLFHWSRTQDSGIRRAYVDANNFGETIMYVWTEPFNG